MAEPAPQTVSFAGDIRPYLQQYLAQMRWRLDLTDYDQVKSNAPLIYGQIESKSMPPPPFAPFSDEFIAKFKTWMDHDCPV